MEYVLKGELHANICHLCGNPLPGITIQLYAATAKDDELVRQVVSNPKNTLGILNDKDLAKYKGKEIGTGVTTDDGSFLIKINPKSGYAGGPIEVHAVITTIPGATRRTPKAAPAHIFITTFQPGWRQPEEAAASIAAWPPYCFPSQIWCKIMALFDVWVICGQVTVCDKTNPLPLVGLKVSAFDADWLADDELGSAVTDSSGHFKIFYTSADFKQTPFSPLINIEWTGGPDVYFKIAMTDGTVLLQEPRSRGRDSDREDIGNCFCVKLCIDMKKLPAPVDNPWFTHVGDFNINSDIDPATGLTRHAVLEHGGPNYGFTGAMKLHGFCPKNDPQTGQPMRYRFLIKNLSTGVETPITGNLVAPVAVGARLIQWDIDGSGPLWTFQSIHIKGSGATPPVTPPPAVPPETPWGPIPVHVIVPDSDGWVAVDAAALDGGFYGPLVGFNSLAAVAGGAAPGSGAGNPPASPKDGSDLQIRFEAGPVGHPATFSNSLPRIHVNNWEEVRELKLDEIGDGCAPLSDYLNVLYTVDHELLANWSLHIRNGSNLLNTVFGNGTGPRGNNSNTAPSGISLAGLPKCSYIVTLSTRRSLTNGNTDDTPNSTQATFCIT